MFNTKRIQRKPWRCEVVAVDPAVLTQDVVGSRKRVLAPKTGEVAIELVLFWGFLSESWTLFYSKLLGKAGGGCFRC